MSSTLIPLILGIIGLFVAYRIYGLVLSYSTGNEKVTKISEAIHQGAMVFMRREYKMLVIFSALLVVLLFVLLGFKTALAFVVGAVASGSAGYPSVSLPRERFWDIPVPKIDSPTRQPLLPRPSCAHHDSVPHIAAKLLVRNSVMMTTMTLRRVGCAICMPYVTPYRS
ncbi:MAG: hypothetical protein G8D58_09260 [gamma proteobacterium symbiont of Phacoides pectinatus]